MIHLPVMLKEVIGFLDPREGDLFIDATLGTGGHSKALLEKGAKVLGLDQDAKVLELAKERLKEFGDRIIFASGNFKDIDRRLKEKGAGEVKGILLDLGVSSFQLQDQDRGFSFDREGPLDMRMDQNSEETAFDLINELPLSSLTELIWTYGQDRYAKRIAEKIVAIRENEGPITSTSELSKAVIRAIPKKVRLSSLRIHAATRTFQAIRIAVNKELDCLEEILPKGLGLLQEKGRMVVISFHSLEDRIVKHTFKRWANEKLVRILTKKPVTTSSEEKAGNPRARSAKLRVCEKI